MCVCVCVCVCACVWVRVSECVYSHHLLADVFEAIPVVVKLISSVYGDTQLLEKVLKSATGKQQDRVCSQQTASTALNIKQFLSRSRWTLRA